MPTECSAIHSSRDCRPERLAGLEVAQPGGAGGEVGGQGRMARHQASPSRPEPRRMSTTVNSIDSTKSTSATTQAEPVSKRWKPRL